MTINNINNNLILIRNKLQDFDHFFRRLEQYFHCQFCDFDELNPILADLAHSQWEVNNTILLIAWDFVDTKLLDKIDLLFSRYQKLDSPYIIFLDAMNEHDETIDFIKGRFFYYLPQTPDLDTKFFIHNLKVYINTLFQLKKNMNRVNDYIVKSFQLIIENRITTKQKKEIESLNQMLEELNKIDYLTNILNRRAFFELLDKELNRTRRSTWRISKEKNIPQSKPEQSQQQDQQRGSYLDHYGHFSCILIDLDYFKQINDTKGHLVGDQVLKKIGKILSLKNILREEDVAGRYGGEEFIILLPETPVKNAIFVAKRLKDYINECEFYDQDGNGFHITVSMGISEYNETDQNSEEIIGRADKALYYSKRHGRDRISIYEDLKEDNLD